mmetsp:Transcript_21036/g.30586  ORF Transcript_21036/g.30586 Transcript_21036/m.30586 type:complete len:178 (-) Transcript_21036:649-1182(-)
MPSANFFFFGKGGGHCTAADVPSRFRDIWRAEGFILFGVPVGTPLFVERILSALLSHHDQLLSELCRLPEGYLQTALLIFRFSACQRLTYFLRRLLPEWGSWLALRADQRAREVLGLLMDAELTVLGDEERDVLHRQIALSVEGSLVAHAPPLGICNIGEVSVAPYFAYAAGSVLPL